MLRGGSRTSPAPREQLGHNPFPPGACATTFSLDPLHTDWLRCDSCGWAAPVAIDPWDDPESLRCLTEDEAASYFPGLAAELRRRSYLRPGAWFGTQEGWEAMAAQG
jgi:hypothetical protein